MTAELLPEIADFDRQFAANQDRARELVRGLTPEAFNERPGPGRWSVAECLEHLAHADAAYDRRIDGMIAEARTKGLVKSGPYNYGWFGRWFANMLEPPVKRRVKTRPVFDIVLGQAYDIEPTLGRYLAMVDRLRAQLRAANGVDLGGVKATSPATRLLSFRLGAVFRILAAHQRRHLWQAEQIVGDRVPMNR